MAFHNSFLCFGCQHDYVRHVMVPDTLPAVIHSVRHWTLHCDVSTDRLIFSPRIWYQHLHYTATQDINVTSCANNAKSSKKQSPETHTLQVVSITVLFKCSTFVTESRACLTNVFPTEGTLLEVKMDAKLWIIFHKQRTFEVNNVRVICKVLWIILQKQLLLINDYRNSNWWTVNQKYTIYLKSFWLYHIVSNWNNLPNYITSCWTTHQHYLDY